MNDIETANEMWEFLRPKRVIDEELLMSRILQECRMDASPDVRKLPRRMQKLKTVAYATGQGRYWERIIVKVAVASADKTRWKDLLDDMKKLGPKATVADFIGSMNAVLEEEKTKAAFGGDSSGGRSCTSRVQHWWWQRPRRQGS